MSNITGYNPALLRPRPTAYYYVPSTDAVTPQLAEKKMPTFLGVMAAIYMISVCLGSMSSEKYSWIPQLVGVATGLLWIVVGMVLLGQPIRWSRPVVLYVLYFAWTSTGFLVTINVEYFYSIWMTTLKVVLISFVILQCVTTRKDLLICCAAVGLASVIISLEGRDTIARALAFAGSEKDSYAKYRASGMLVSHANDLAMFAVLAICCGVACLMCYKSVFFKIVGILSIVSGLYLVAASGSRTAMVGVFVGAVALYYYHFRKAGAGNIGKKLTIMVLSAMLLGGTVYYVSTLPFFFRMKSIMTDKSARETESRYVYFFRSLETMVEHPVIGLGMGGFALHGLGSTRQGQGHYSHSTLSETISTTGIPGFLLYYGSQLSLFNLIRRVRKLDLPRKDMTTVNIIMAIFWIVTVFGIVAVLMYHRLLWPYLAACCGYLWTLERTYGRNAQVQYVS